MLQKKERIAWIFIVLFAVILTFLVTSKLSFAPQDQNAVLSSTKVFTDIEQEANQWFISRASVIPRRDFFTQSENNAPLLIYQGYIKQGAPWINYPEQIALRVFYPPPEVEGFVPDKVNIYFHHADIAVVTVITSSPFGANERRFDFVRIDNIWKIVWVGERSIRIE